MTAKLAAAFAAGALTVGVLIGAAGTVLVHDATRGTVDMGDMARMHTMMSGMGGSMMDGAMGLGDSMNPGDHSAHHPGSDQ